MIEYFNMDIRNSSHHIIKPVTFLFYDTLWFGYAGSRLTDCSHKLWNKCIACNRFYQNIV